MRLRRVMQCVSGMARLKCSVSLGWLFRPSDLADRMKHIRCLALLLSPARRTLDSLTVGALIGRKLKCLNRCWTALSTFRKVTRLSGRSLRMLGTACGPTASTGGDWVR